MLASAIFAAAPAAAQTDAAVENAAAPSSETPDSDAEDAAADGAADPSIADADAAADPSIAEAPAAPSRLAGIERFVDGYAAAVLATRTPPAMMVTVVTPDETFMKTYGVANVETGAPADNDTLFRIASISKTFVWVSVMMLVEEGRLDLDADVNDYLKGYQVPDAFDAPVTMNDIMAHRAGFEDTMGDFLERYGDKTFDEALAAHAPARVAPPGLRTSYSNWATGLAAKIVSDISGEPYADFLRARLLEPLGMDATTLFDPASAADRAYNPPALDARIAAPHDLKAGAPAVATHDGLHPLFAAGAMSLDAGDAAKWMRFLLRGGVADDGTRLISADTFARMRTRNFDDRPNANDMAHGFMEREIAGAWTFGHGGALSGFLSNMTIAPSIDAGVFVAINGRDKAHRPDVVTRVVVEELAGADPYATAAPKVDSSQKAAAEELAGTYLGVRRLHEKVEKASALGGDVTVSAYEDGSLVITSGGSASRYYPLSDDLWTNLRGNTIKVYRDASGKVVRYSSSSGTNSYERIGFLASSKGFYAGVGAGVGAALLVLLAAWRRQGRTVEQTGAGRALAAWQVALAVLWLAAIGYFLFVARELGEADFAELTKQGWPPAQFRSASLLLHIAAAGLALNVLAFLPVLTASGWSLWRKGHHLLFAAAGAFALYALWEWRVILAPTTMT